MPAPVVKERIVLKYLKPISELEDKMYVGWNDFNKDYIPTDEILCMGFSSMTMAEEEQVFIKEPTEIKFLRYSIEEVDKITDFSNR